MNRTLWFLGLLSVLFIALQPLRAADKPNIILVLSDDVGLGRVSCYGGEPFKTPHLDRMAANGVRFERCYSMPLCGPSRAVLLTGLYPFRTGATHNGNSVIDPTKHPTLPLVLRQAGYATCAIGKLGQSAPPDDAEAPKRLGFDESMLWMGRGTPDRYWNPRYYRNGVVVQGKPDEYGPDLTHAFLVDFMKRHRDRPFFVYYSSVLTHGPFVRTPDSKDDSNVVVDMMSYLDKQMGQLVAELEKLQLHEKTIILFTSDNGPQGNPLGQIRGRPMLGAKGDTTEGGVREPLIVYGPGRVPAGKVCRDLTDFSDFFPTVLELTGTKPPEGLQLDGYSIAPQILGKPGRARPWVYAQVGTDYFIADHRYKLYGNGKFVDISDSPCAETPATDTEAKRRLQEALNRLRAGFDGKDRAPLRPEAAPDLNADLRLLMEQKIVTDADYWLANATAKGRVEGARAAELLMAIARKFKPVAGLDDAIAVLKQEGILSSADYWRKHAVPGEHCSGANVARLINKTAQRLKAN